MLQENKIFEKHKNDKRKSEKNECSQRIKLKLYFPTYEILVRVFNVKWSYIKILS